MKDIRNEVVEFLKDNGFTVKHPDEQTQNLCHTFILHSLGHFYANVMIPEPPIEEIVIGDVKEYDNVISIETREKLSVIEFYIKELDEETV